MAIPKRVFTIWLTEDKSVPCLVKRCIDSQQCMCEAFGYEYKVIGLPDAFKDSKYAQECLSSSFKKEKWCKYSDYLRAHYLIESGGIYLDADVEILPGKNFNGLLGYEMFVGKEKLLPGVGSNWLGTAVIGAEQGHWFLRRWTEEVEKKFRGDDNKNFESSMELLTERYYAANKEFHEKMLILEPDVFFPYCHLDESINLTGNSVCIHHFLKSWI